MLTAFGYQSTRVPVSTPISNNNGRSSRIIFIYLQRFSIGAYIVWTSRRLVVEKAFLVKLFPLLIRREIQEVVTYVPGNPSDTRQAPVN